MHNPARLALSLLTAAVLTPGSAEAYEARRTTNGQPVRWDAATITLVADPSLATLGPGAMTAVSRAFAAWNAVRGAAAPGVIITEGAVDEAGYHAGTENMNTLRYMPSGYGPAKSALAITMLTFDESGLILDADIVINGGPSRGFGVMPDGASKGESEHAAHGEAYDLQDVLTHEAGHVFGLAHNDEDESVTMYFASARGETKKRDLARDDEDGLRFLYPETRGFTASCSVDSAPGSARGGLSVVAAAVVLAALRGTQRRRGTKPR